MTGTIPACVVALALAACVTPSSASVPRCEPRSLPPGSLAIVRELIQLGSEQHGVRFERQLEDLLENRAREGDVALAYLLGVYLGESPAEELACDAINRGPRMAPLVREFRDCPPSTGMEPLPAGTVLDGRGLQDAVLRDLAQGKTCRYED